MDAVGKMKYLNSPRSPQAAFPLFPRDATLYT
jgi:hypothetical protein